jgi:hypothetical protein
LKQLSGVLVSSDRHRVGAWDWREIPVFGGLPPKTVRFHCDQRRAELVAMKAASFWWLLNMWLSKLHVHARESLHLQPRGQGDAVLLDSEAPAPAAGSLVGRAGCLLGVIDD